MSIPQKHFDHEIYLDPELAEDKSDQRFKFGSSCSIQEQMPHRTMYPCSINQLPLEDATTNTHTVKLASYGCFFSDDKLKFKSGRKNELDRFVPNRKDSKLNIDINLKMAEEQNMQNLYKRANGICQGFSMAEIYRKHVLGLSKDVLKQSSSFKNSNNLRFSQKQFEFADQIGSSKSLIQIQKEIVKSIPQPKRKIAKQPIKVLDAPGLQDDFYLNLLDWSQSNILAVALSENMYLWNGSNNKVSKIGQSQQNVMLTSSAWAPYQNNILSFGNDNGEIQIWDVYLNKKIRTFTGHTGRVGTIAWNNHNQFSTGSKDKSILHRDLRDNQQFTGRLLGHKQQICGLKWSFDHQQLASGGNDNRLMIWNNNSMNPVHNITKHTAAVKALAWSPHQHGLLVSGGGTADRTMRFWNTINGECTKMIEGNSQVCNLMFSKTVNQLVSTHGFSQNQINIWKIPSLEKVSTLMGHSYRVLYLAMSPDGSTIVTGAGDQTLKFWNVFPCKPKEQASDYSQLEAFCLR